MMVMNMKIIHKAAPHLGNPSFFTLFRSYSALDITNSTHLENLIRKRCKSGTLKLDEALGFFNSLIHIRPMPSIWAFNHLIGALSKLNHYSTVISMFKEMMRYVDFCPGVGTMAIVIKCYCHLNRVDLGFSVLAIILKHGLQPDAFSLNTLLHGLCRQSKSMDGAVELFERIVGIGDPCDHITYATIIGALCKTHNSLKAIEIFKQMQEAGNIKPSVHCFTPIIDTLCKERYVNRALELFQDMVQQDVQPDVVTYTALFNGLCKSGRVKEAKKFLNDMIDCGISPDVYIYNALIDPLCKVKKTHEAISLFELMIRKGIKPTVVTFTSLISGLCHSGQWREATRLLDKMKDQGVLPDVVTFNTLVHALCKQRRTKEALSLLDLMIQRDIKPNVMTYTSLLNALCKSTQWEEATRLLKQMASLKVFPDTMILNLLLDGLARREMTGKAYETFKLVIEHLKSLKNT